MDKLLDRQHTTSYISFRHLSLVHNFFLRKSGSYAEFRSNRMKHLLDPSSIQELAHEIQQRRHQVLQFGPRSRLELQRNFLSPETKLRWQLNLTELYYLRK